MTGEPVLLIRWNNWSGGEYGTRGARRAQVDQFSGINVMPYPDGSIGPRPGLVKLSLTSSHIYWPPTLGTGQIQAIGWFPPNGYIYSDYGTIWMIDSNGRYWYGPFPSSPTGTCTMSIGTATAGLSPITKPHVIKTDDLMSYLIDPSAGLIQINHASHDAKRITTAPTGTCIAYNDKSQYVIGGVIASPDPDGITPATRRCRIRFSAFNDPNSWPVDNYVDLPNHAEITSVIPQRDSLVIIQADFTTWLISGTLGAGAVLRKIAGTHNLVNAIGIPPESRAPHRWARTENGMIWGQYYNPRFPVRFNGARYDYVDHIRIAGDFQDDDLTAATIAAGGPDGVVMLGGATAEVPYVGASNVSTLGGCIYTGAGDGATFSTHAFYVNGGHVDNALPTSIASGPDGMILFCERNQTANGRVNAWAWYAQAALPPCVAASSVFDQAATSRTFFDFGFLGAAWKPVQDTGAGTYPYTRFTTSELHAAGGRNRYRAYGRDFNPRHVVIKFTSYRWTGSTGQNNTFDVEVNCADLTDDSFQVVQAGSWSQLASASATTGTRQVVEYGLDSSGAGALSVTIKNLVGCKIDEIALYGDSEQPRLA